MINTIPDHIRKFVCVRDGELVWKRKPARSKISVGQRCGSDISGGRLQMKFEGKRYGVARVAYYLHTGEQPEMVDHKDRNPSNNSIDNLRAASVNDNNRNKSVQKNSSSGVPGVNRGRRGNWRASVWVNGKEIYLGQFPTVEQAAIARQKGAEKYYGEFCYRPEPPEDV